jgi:predicted ArsR family transcriptional regulator
MVTQTSLLAYQEAKTKLGRTQSAVLESLEDIAPATNKMVAESLGWAINSVTPRMLELRKKGKVEADHIGIDIGGRKAIFWKPVSD